MTIPYITGTIALFNGSAAVVGSGTAWETSLITGGTIHVQAPGGNSLPIASVDDDTHITAALLWEGADGVYPYALIRDTTYNTQQVANANTLAELIAGLRQGTIFKYDVAGTLANKATYDTKPQGFAYLAIDTNPARLYIKLTAAAGDWAGPFSYAQGPQGVMGPAGFTRFRGTYAVATPYARNDGVLYNGSSFVALQDTTGNFPPNLPTTANAYWSLLASKGTDGTGIGDMVKAIYDPNNIGRDVFDGANQRGAGLANYISPNFNLANGTDAVNDIDFPAGVVASDESSPILMVHAAGTAQLDVAFGTGNGGRFDAAISDTTWHCFVISDGVSVKRGFSASLNPTTQPNYPAGYTHYRRVMSVRRIGGTIFNFTQRNNFVKITPQTNRSSTAAFPTALQTVSVPVGINVIPLLQSVLNTAASSNASVNIGDGDGTATIAVHAEVGSSTNTVVVPPVFWTNTTQQILYGVGISAGSLTGCTLITLGWIDPRGQW